MPATLAYGATGHLAPRVTLIFACGAIAFSLMSMNLVMATRLPGLDALFGGLDQVYWVHKWTGILLIFPAFAHQQIRANFRAELVTANLNNLAVEVAEFAFWPLMALVVLSFVKRIPKLPFEFPYHIWRQTHRVLGLIFIAFAFHMYFVKTPFDNNAMLMSYLTGLGLIGIAAFLYTQLGDFTRSRGYRVARVTPHKAATIVDLDPTGSGVKMRPGGFAFVSFKAEGLREPHPFTVSEIRGDGGIQFSIRGLGDYTSRLRDVLKDGVSAKVEGGYGRFNWKRGGDKQIWVAAGIGITPFLAWSDSLPDQGGPEVHLYHCVRDRSEVVGLDRLERNAARAQGFNLHIYESEERGRFGPQVLKDELPFEIGQASFWFCGPGPMRKALIAGLSKLGAKPKSVHFERFEFR